MRSKKEIRIVSKFPSIGRGNALQDNLVTRKQLDEEIDKIINSEV